MTASLRQRLLSSYTPINSRLHEIAARISLPDRSPIFSDEALLHFAELNQTKQVLAVSKRFVVPIPDLNDGIGPLQLANAKELVARIGSGSSENAITSIRLEGVPQIVPPDGTNVVIINTISVRQARAFQVTYHDMLAERGGEVDREMLIEFLEFVTGLSYDPAFNSVSLVPDNLGIHPDVYNQLNETFLDRHYRVDTRTPLTDKDITPGYFEKKPELARAYFVAGHFRRRTEYDTGNTIQHFPKGGMIAIGQDGIVSAISLPDIDVCYKEPSLRSLVSKNGPALPPYRANKVLRASIDRPPRRWRI